MIFFTYNLNKHNVNKMTYYLSKISSSKTKTKQERRFSIQHLKISRILPNKIFELWLPTSFLFLNFLTHMEYFDDQQKKNLVDT